MNYLKYLTDEDVARDPFDGTPLRGFSRSETPMLKPDEFENLPESYDAKVRVFDLSNEEHLKEYTNVMDHVCNGAWFLLKPDLEMIDEEKKTWKILCRWAQPQKDIPPAMRRNAGVL